MPGKLCLRLRRVVSLVEAVLDARSLVPRPRSSLYTLFFNASFSL